jgi:pimeloyl-ACP methyl ester carboxylesterase
MGREDIGDRLPEITAPASVFHGEEDATLSMDKAQHLTRELPGCESVARIPGAGHASNLSHPDEVNELLWDFLRRHAPG